MMNILNFNTKKKKLSELSMTRSGKIVYLMIRSIRDKLNIIETELKLNGINECTEKKIIDIYTKLKE